MKNLFLIFLLLSYANAFAQINIRNISLSKPDSAILYSNIENVLELKGISNESNIKLNSTNSIISKRDGKFTVQPHSVKDDTITIYKGNNKAFEKVFKVASIGDSEIGISNSLDTFLSKDRILAIPSISIIFPNCIYLKLGVVHGFKVAIMRSGKESQDFYSNTDSIPKDALEEIKKLKHGDKIIFTAIRYAVAPSFCPRISKEKTITIL